MNNITDLQVDTMVLIEEVKDGIAENLFNQLTLTEIDTVIQRLEILRQQLRRRRSLQIGTTELPINNTLTSIKDYIMAAKDFKTKTRFLEKKSKDDVIQQQQLSIIVHQIEQIFQKDIETADIEVLLRLRSESATYVRKYEKIADNYKEVLKSPINDVDRMHDITTIVIASKDFLA